MNYQPSNLLISLSLLESFLRLGLFTVINWLTDSECAKEKLTAELLCIKHDYLNLDLLSADEVDAVIEFLCTSTYADFIL